MRAMRIQIKSSKMQIRHTRNTAVLHVSATKMSQNFGFQSCKAYHIAKGWSDIGYHFYIEKDGTVFFGRPLERNGAHVRGFNSDTLGIIEPFEFSKACPCYDAKQRFKIFNGKLEDILKILGR